MKKYDDKTKKRTYNNNINVEQSNIEIIDCDDWAWDQFVVIDN